LLVTYPSAEDLDHPEYGEKLERYLEAAAGYSGRERLAVFNLVSDLTASDYAGYQNVLAVHAEGSIEAEELTSLAQDDPDHALRYARGLGDLDSSPLPPDPTGHRPPSV